MDVVLALKTLGSSRGLASEKWSFMNRHIRGQRDGQSEALVLRSWSRMPDFPYAASSAEGDVMCEALYEVRVYAGACAC